MLVPASGASRDHQLASGRLPSGKALLAMASATLVVVASLATGMALTTGAGSTTPQIPGSPAAPSASEVSPICTTTDPASVLGPASSTLPTAPVSKVVTPSGGVVALHGHLGRAVRRQRHRDS